jgi:hypothetical protein
MLNRLARYYPVLKFYKSSTLPHTILEIGSGALGIGEFLAVSFIGVDIKFSPPFSAGNVPVYAAGSALPFRDNTFYSVLCLDTLEHVPCGQREALLAELVRVSSKHIIVGFPFGTNAKKIDMRLSAFYVRRKIELPSWLIEHTGSLYPDSSAIGTSPQIRIVQCINNENIWVHLLIMKAETYKFFNKLLTRAAHSMGTLCGWLIHVSSIGTPYRKIYILEKMNTP